jgi:hypothetical protein
MRRTPNDADAAAVCFLAGNARSKVHVSKGKAAITLFLNCVGWRFRFGIPSVPKKLYELLAVFVCGKAQKSPALIFRNDLGDFVAQPRTISRPQFVTNILWPLLGFLLVGCVCGTWLCGAPLLRVGTERPQQPDGKHEKQRAPERNPRVDTSMVVLHCNNRRPRPTSPFRHSRGAFYQTLNRTTVRGLPPYSIVTTRRVHALTFGIGCTSGQYSVRQCFRHDGPEENIMAKCSDTYRDSAASTAMEKRFEAWSQTIKEACDFFVARAGWVWLILSIGLIAGALSTK